MPPIYAAWAACGSFMERERWTPQVVPEGRSARPLFRVRFPGAAFTSGDVVFIEKKRETAMRLAGGAIENARRLYGSGGFQCPHLGDALAPRMGGSSPPRSRSACGFVVRPLRCMVRVWQGLFLKILCLYVLRAWCQDWLLFGLCWFCRVRVLGAVSHS